MPGLAVFGGMLPDLVEQERARVRDLEDRLTQQRQQEAETLSALECGSQDLAEAWAEARQRVGRAKAVERRLTDDLEDLGGGLGGPAYFWGQVEAAVALVVVAMGLFVSPWGKINLCLSLVCSLLGFLAGLGRE